MTRGSVPLQPIAFAANRLQRNAAGKIPTDRACAAMTSTADVRRCYTKPMQDSVREMLSRVPEAALPVSTAIEQAIEHSVQYLASADAMVSIAADTYWPKWHSPWWHMVLLHEIGEARRIPERIATAMVDGLNALPIRIFPIHPEDVPSGTDPHRDSACHCALGCIYQVLSACGLDVDAALPWIKPWFVRYQMADGGLSCDATAYLQDECPSSMVSTVAPFEAMLLGGPATWTSDQRVFLARAARFLVERRLVLGSETRHNAEERHRQAAWLLPCRPRFYLYDVVRGLGALVRWAEASESAVPLHAVSATVDHLVVAFPDGIVRLGRRSFEGVTTMLRTEDGTWIRRQPASSFPLLEATSTIGAACPYATREWSASRRGLLRLQGAGRLAGDA